MAFPSSCVVIAVGEPLNILKILYIFQWPKGSDRITNDLENNCTVVADIIVVVDISCSGICFTYCLSVEMDADGVSASNDDVGDLDRPPGDLY